MKKSMPLTSLYYATRIIMPVALWGLLYCGLFAQTVESVITANERAQVIDSLAVYMEKDYVFEDIGNRVAVLLRSNFSRGLYDKLSDPPDFAEKLTEDIRSLNNDLHLAVYYDPQRIKQERDVVNLSPEAIEAFKRQSRIKNYGFSEVKILPGNIGYLKFVYFDGSEEAMKTAEGAMAFLRSCDALIIDLRENGGGDPKMVQLLISYLYKADSEVLINTFLTRDKENPRQYWNAPFISGEHMPDTEVAVLVSGSTFSCAEEFAYDLQNLKRATIVGETTGGGAHPVNFFTINDNFVAKISYGRAYNPISKTNWEGVGIVPDIKVTASDALEHAKLLLIEKLMDKEQNPDFKAKLKWDYATLQVMLNPVSIPEKILKSYAGKYDVRNVTFENGNLYYQREGRAKLKMLPMTKDTFYFADIPYFRLRVILKEGVPESLEGIYDDGRTDSSPKSK